MSSHPGAAVPVEAILKLALDKAGADDIQRFLDGHEQSWSRIEQSVSKIGQHAESLTRMGLGLAGVAGISAVFNNFMQTSQAGSNVALAGGNVTGGAGVWHPYAQAMLGAQAKTGVDRLDIAQGLIMALQAVGGNPTPNQAMMLGGLIAGYGQTVGMTPAQVAQVIAPLMQAANKPLTGANILSEGAALSGGLTAFPGSQAAPMLGLLSQLGVAQALGIGPAGGFTPNIHGLTATVNAAAQSNSIWRSPSTTGGAINSISGGLQNAYGNPSQEAFMQMAGISYNRQRAGFTPQNMQSIMSEATRLYGSGTTRDIFLRSMFGLQGSDLLEQFAPGSKSWQLLQQNLEHHASSSALGSQIANAQQRTTPNATANRAGGGLLGWLESSPLTGAVGVAGVLGGPAVLKALAKRGVGGTSTLFGSSAGEAGDGALADLGGTTLDDLLVSGLAGGLSLGVGTAASALIFPDSVSGGGASGARAEAAVKQVLAAAQRRFGKNIGSKQAQQWMWNQFGHREPSIVGAHGPGAKVPQTRAWDMATEYGESPHGATVAQQMLTKLFAQLGTGQDPITTFAQAAAKLLQAANQMSSSGRHGASYDLGGSSGQQVSYLGTSGVQQLGAIAPGMEFAALTSGAGSGSGGGFVSLLGGGSGASAAGGVSGSHAAASTSGGGWQTAVASWYDPGAGGINGSYGGGAWSGHPVEPNTYGFAHKTMAFGTQVQFRYRGKTITATCVDRGPFVAGRSFDLLPGPARDLGMTSAGVVTLQYRVIGSSGGTGTKSGAPGSSGSSSAGTSGSVVSDMSAAASSPAATGASGFAGAGGGGGFSGSGGGQPVQVNVHIDGRKIHTSRTLRGHKA